MINRAIREEMNYLQRKRYQRREFFEQYYQEIWKKTKVLTDLERKLVDLSFGLSGEMQSHRALAEHFQLKSPQQVKCLIHCALNKLRKERALLLALKQHIPPHELETSPQKRKN